MRLAALAALAGLSLAAATPAFAQIVEARVSDAFQEKLIEDYGVREGDVLKKSLTTRVEQAFANKAVKPARVVVTIEDAKPNRPTFQQVSDTPGLDAGRSISIGGARVTGVAYDASGAVIGNLDYDWFETDLSQVNGSATWSDARWSFDRFARRFAERLG